MADKATLLQSVPPVAKKSTSVAKRADTRIEASTGTQTQPDVSISMSTFQAATYGSFVLTFVLAGFAAVVLFRKALDAVERRFRNSAMVLGCVFAPMAMHGFFASYNYTSYLREGSHTVPVSLTLLSWIVLGAAIGYLSNRLLQVKDKLKTGEALIDVFSYAIIFILLILAVSPETNANTSLILSLIALVLCTVPLARFFIAYKSKKFRHPQLQQKSTKRLLFSLALFPSLLPLVALFHVFKAFGPDTTLFCVNLISSSFILLVSFSMLQSMKVSKSEPAGEKASATPAASPEAAATVAPGAAQAIDPLVEELLAEETADKLEAETKQKTEPAPKIEPVADFAPKKSKTPNVPKKPPSRQPSPAGKNPGLNPPKKPGPKPPKKPDPLKKEGNKPAPNSPSRIKAPAKPKKRF